MAAAGLIVVTAFVSPYRADRERVRKVVEGMHGSGRFFEIFVDVPIEVCEARDPKVCIRRLELEKLKTSLESMTHTNHPLHRSWY